MKRSLSLTIIAASLAFAIAACKDDFNEGDFLRLQSELKLKQDEVIRQRIDSASEESVKEYIAAANEAGDLLAVSLIIRENGNALEGVSVSLSSGTPGEISSGRAKATTAGVTDASGMVVFDRVTIGKGTATFFKEGFVSATATYDFGTPAPPVRIQISNPNGGNTIRYVPPQKRFEEAAITMISASPSSGSTATITGKVSIENDVTNTTPEVPEGIVLRANLTSLVTAPTNLFTSFTLADNSTLGKATINADGTFTMTVPATVAGNDISLIIPNIEGTSRMAVNGYDDGTGTTVTLPNGPEYKDVPTSWGPQAQSGFGNIVPEVAGAKLVFPEPPPSGTGLTFDLTPVPRPLVANTSAQITSAQTTKVGETFFKIVRRGSYGSGPAPTVTITGGGGQGAVVDPFMRTYVSALTVTNPGSGYTGNITLQIERVRHDDQTVLQGDAITVAATPGGTLPATIDLSAFQNSTGFHPTDQATMTGTDLKTLRIRVTGDGNGGAVSATFKTELQRLDFSPTPPQQASGLGNPGSGFTSAPTITFAGGGLPNESTDHASVQVVEFPVNWTITPNNSAATDYPIVPLFSINYPIDALGNSKPAELNVESWSASGTMESAGVFLASKLAISNGDVVPRDPATVLRTISKSAGKPSIRISTATPRRASRTMLPTNINANGSVITFPFNGTNGDEYNFPLTVSVEPAAEGAPGSGCSVSLSCSFEPITGEYHWVGVNSIDSQGSGYLQNLNQKEVENASFPSAVTVQAGKTYPLEIRYGTGNRKVNVN